jgi:ABC-type branched-subunit amino acid transport system substrate-binding protein
LLLFGAGAGHAQTKPIKVGAALDFTKVYTFVSTEYSQGQRDYITLLNGRGGIGGTPVDLETVDTGNEPQRGIEAYERFKNEGAVLVDFLSTPVSRAVVPRALADGMNVITAFHGRSDAADGSVFPTIFPMTPAYWSQATDIVKYIGDKEAGNIKGKKILLVHIDSPSAKSPSRFSRNWRSSRASFSPTWAIPPRVTSSRRNGRKCGATGPIGWCSGGLAAASLTRCARPSETASLRTRSCR